MVNRVESIETNATTNLAMGDLELLGGDTE
jgi:hypothetical protein